MIDLLNPGPKRVNLTVRWNKKSRAFVVDNLFAIECSELEDLVGVLEEGKGAFINYVTQVASSVVGNVNSFLNGIRASFRSENINVNGENGQWSKRSNRKD